MRKQKSQEDRIIARDKRDLKKALKTKQAKVFSVGPLSFDGNGNVSAQVTTIKLIPTKQTA